MAGVTISVIKAGVGGHVGHCDVHTDAGRSVAARLADRWAAVEEPAGAPVGA